MPAPAPAARKVKIRDVATGQVLEVWPVDAREYVKTPGYEYWIQASPAEAESAPEYPVTPPAPPAPPKTVRERLSDKSYKELQQIAKKAGLSASQSKDDLVETLAAHVEGGSISLEELVPLALPQAQFPNANATE